MSRMNMEKSPFLQTGRTSAKRRIMRRIAPIMPVSSRTAVGRNPFSMELPVGSPKTPVFSRLSWKGSEGAPKPIPTRGEDLKLTVC